MLWSCFTHHCVSFLGWRLEDDEVDSALRQHLTSVPFRIKQQQIQFGSGHVRVWLFTANLLQLNSTYVGPIGTQYWAMNKICRRNAGSKYLP
jgi:hypothetical protein